MLVLLGPDYDGSEEAVFALVQETGLGQYDLRARLRPGTWGVLRALANEEQAEDLVRRLKERGLSACAISPAVGQDVGRRVVYLRGIRFNSGAITLRLAGREMAVPYGALLVIVRGDVHVGRTFQGTSTGAGSGSLRPSSGGASLLSSSNVTGEVFREQRAPVELDVFAAADLHFATVNWVARIDARELDFPQDYVDIPNLAERLDRCVDDLAIQASIRVDRALKTSSLASHTMGAQRAATPSPSGSSAARRVAGTADDHFDAYSRMVAEAERQLLSH